VTVVLALAFTLAGFLLGFGNDGSFRQGAWSRYVFILGGFIWLGALIAAFTTRGITYGLVAVVASFAVVGLTMPLGSRAVSKLRGH
jgi:hypothetical protein